MTLPLVSISILNYQRKETLRRALDRARGQTYPHLEILVVDNASTDGSDRMVEAEFPGVRLVKLAENVGCAARNAGVAAARGEIVVTIDNDVLLTDVNDVRTVVDIFAEHPAVACVNCKILDADGALSRRDWCHPRDWRRFADQEFLTHYVLEGASAFRRAAFLGVGGYWPPFFIGHEGEDLALRLVGAGYDLLYSPRVSVMHLTSPEARPPSRIYYTFIRNDIWVSLRNHRPLAAVGTIGKAMALMAFSAVRAGHAGGYVRGLWDAARGAPTALASRRPLSRAAYRRLRHVKALEPNLLQKVKRHWRERPI